MFHAPQPCRVFLLRAVVANSLVGAAASARAQTKVEETDHTAIGLDDRHDTTKVDARKHPQHKPDQRCSTCQFWHGSANVAWCMVWKRVD